MMLRNQLTCLRKQLQIIQKHTLTTNKYNEKKILLCITIVYVKSVRQRNNYSREKLLLNLTLASGFQFPTGGSGGMGAPSRSKSHCSRGISCGNDSAMIDAVSCARVMDEFTNRE